MKTNFKIRVKKEKKYDVVVIAASISTGERITERYIIRANDENEAIETAIGRTWKYHPPEKYYCFVDSVRRVLYDKNTV